MHPSDFSYHLPEGLIANAPVEPRDSCRLLKLSRETGETSHHIFRDLTDLIPSNSVLVLNDTKVFPARLFGTKSTGGKIETLLLHQKSPNLYLCIGRGKVRVGEAISFENELIGRIISKNSEGEMLIEFNLSGPVLYEAIEKIGRTPLPPYIHSTDSEKKLREEYQTIYAKYTGSAAAPTAGLHFTPELLERLKSRGIILAFVTLHVGLGTFKPVTDDQIANKSLHAEHYSISSENADIINAALSNNQKIIAVGTTTTRALESSAREGRVMSGSSETQIFIQPGYKFQIIDGLITNFHLPETSLLMLVTALVSSPNTETPFTSFQESSVFRAYSEAIENRYRFFSFGDAMLII